jgi:ribonuclease R/exosome complex exonuclease DIS3/RRP44
MEKHKNDNNSSRKIEGIINISHRGTGTVRLGDKENRIIEIDHNFLKTACHGDTVIALLHPKRKDGILTGEVLKIINRSKKGYAGILEKENDTYFLIPSDLKMYSDIIIPKNKLNEAKIGQKVFATITEWIDAKKAPIGEIEKILGMPMENDAEMEATVIDGKVDNLLGVLDWELASATNTDNTFQTLFEW